MEPGRVRDGVSSRPGVRDEIRSLTGLRALAAGWVVVFHFWLITPGDFWGPTLEPLRPLLKAGWLGVDLFFVLSGFVLTHTYLLTMGDRPRLRGTLDFYWNRLSRVWPTWAVVTVCFTGWLALKHLTVGGTHLHERTQPSIGVVPLLEQLGMVQLWTRPWFSGASAVGPGWSLSAEWLAYCAFPVVVLVLFRLRRCPAVVLGAAAVAVLLPFAYSAGVLGLPDFPWSWLVRIGGGFLAGALVAMCVRQVPRGPEVSRRAGAVATATCIALLVGLWWAETAGRNGVGAMVVLFPVLVGALALSDGGPGPARRLSAPWLVTGGRISFALYLVHECVFEVFWTLMDVVPLLSTDRPWAALLQPVVLLVPVPVAYLVWRFVEEPARLRMRRMTRPPTPAAAPVPAPREAPATARLAAQAGARQARPLPVEAGVGRG